MQRGAGTAGPAEDELGPPFEVRVAFGESETRLRVLGEVDIRTADQLAGAVDLALRNVPSRLVVELDRTDFLGLEGLAALDEAGRRLSEGGGTLVISGATSTVVKSAAATGLCSTADFVLRSASEPAGAEASIAGSGPGIDWRELAEPAATTDLIDSVFRLATVLGLQLIPAAGAVSVSFTRAGALRTVASSDEVAVELDEAQYSAGDGPCVEASRTGTLVRATPLSADPRWAGLAARARSAGVGGVISVPLVATRRPIGALNVYALSTASISSADEASALRLAAQLSGLLDAAGAGHSGGERVDALAEMWSAREVIAQAQGVVMEREGLGADDAFAVLRSFSVSRERPLVDLAREIVASTRRPGPRG